MGVWTRAIIGVHLEFKAIRNDDVYSRKFGELFGKVEEMLKIAMIPNPEYDLGEVLHTDKRGFAIGSRMKGIDYLCEASICQSEIPKLNDNQMKALDMIADFSINFLKDTGDYADFKKTVGLAVHSTS